MNKKCANITYGIYLLILAADLYAALLHYDSVKDGVTVFEFVKVWAEELAIVSKGRARRQYE